MATRKVDSGLAAAKLSVWQAVLVALITTFGGAIAGAWLQKQPPPPKQHWLTISAVKASNGNADLKKIRLIATVNSVAFAYPTVEPWLNTNGHVPKTRFPLPISSDNVFRVGFSGFAVDATSNVLHLCGVGDFQEIRPQTPLQEHSATLVRSFYYNLEEKCGLETELTVTFAVE